jgi:hypothetical protein
MSLNSLDCVIIHQAEKKKTQLLYVPVLIATRNENTIIR